jgi:hypothetical protein
MSSFEYCAQRKGFFTKTKFKRRFDDFKYSKREKKFRNSVFNFFKTSPLKIVEFISLFFVYLQV